jgi:hypothetical protein
MLSPESLETYRRMTSSERLRITLQMIREATPYLLAGPPEQVARRFERLRAQNELRNQRILEGIARSRLTDGNA